MAPLSLSHGRKKPLTRLAYILIFFGIAIITHPALAGGGETILRLSSRWIRYPREAYAILSMVAMIFSKLSGIVAVIASALYARNKKAWTTSYNISLLIGAGGGFYAVREITGTSYGFLQENSAWLSIAGAVIALITWSIVATIKVEEAVATPGESKTVVNCLNCGQKLRLTRGQSGYVRCPSCDHSFYKET